MNAFTNLLNHESQIMHAWRIASRDARSAGFEKLAALAERKEKENRGRFDDSLLNELGFDGSHYSIVITSRFAPALINNDTTGLDETEFEELARIRAFCEGKSPVDCGPEFFGWCEALQIRGTVCEFTFRA